MRFWCFRLCNRPQTAHISSRAEQKTELSSAEQSLARTMLASVASRVHRRWTLSVVAPVQHVVSFPRNFFSTEPSEEDIPIEELANSIDTTLSPEQKAYVAMLKKKIRGGANSPRSVHREVPFPHEIKATGNFMPKMADNAEALIDYALSHIPPRAGRRGNRKKRRMERKHETKRAYDAMKKKEIAAANLRKLARQKRIRAEVKAVREEARKIQELQRMKADVRRASAVAAAKAKL